MLHSPSSQNKSRYIISNPRISFVCASTNIFAQNEAIMSSGCPSLLIFSMYCSSLKQFFCKCSPIDKNRTRPCTLSMINVQPFSQKAKTTLRAQWDIQRSVFLKITWNILQERCNYRIHCRCIDRKRKCCWKYAKSRPQHRSAINPGPRVFASLQLRASPTVSHFQSSKDSVLNLKERYNVTWMLLYCWLN